MTLTERALRLHYNTERAITAPTARLLPPPVRTLIGEMSELLRDMAAAIDATTRDKSHGA